jgi:hypothetical protein
LIYGESVGAAADFLMIAVARHVAPSISRQCRRYSIAAIALIGVFETGECVRLSLARVQAQFDCHCSRTTCYIHADGQYTFGDIVTDEAVSVIETIEHSETHI